jgi:hypothetical protein
MKSELKNKRENLLKELQYLESESQRLETIINCQQKREEITIHKAEIEERLVAVEVELAKTEEQENKSAEVGKELNSGAKIEIEKKTNYR